MSNLTDAFLKDTYSTSQARKRINVLKSYLSQKFFNSASSEVTQDQLNWVNSLGEDFFKEFSPTNLDGRLEELNLEIKKIQTLTIFIPFDMPEEEVNKLGSWLRSKFKQKFTFEVRIDPELIGGCALSYKGVYKDYSLREKIKQNQNKVLESLRSYAR